MTYTIRRWTDNAVLIVQDATTLRVALERAVRRGAVLRGADLTGADLRGADLERADL